MRVYKISRTMSGSVLIDLDRVVMIEKSEHKGDNGFTQYCFDIHFEGSEAPKTISFNGSFSRNDAFEGLYKALSANEGGCKR